jgi:spore coat-associated protein N
VASVGVVGDAAGLGTMGTITGTTSPAPVAIRSGVTSIALSAADGSATVPLAFTGPVPGTSVTRRLDLVNDGGTALSSVRLATVATRSSALDTDTVNGLQMTGSPAGLPGSATTCAPVPCARCWPPDRSCGTPCCPARPA